MRDVRLLRCSKCHPDPTDIGENLSGCLNRGATELLLNEPVPLEADRVVAKLAADKRYQFVATRLQETLAGLGQCHLLLASKSRLDANYSCWDYYYFVSAKC